MLTVEPVAIVANSGNQPSLFYNLSDRWVIRSPADTSATKYSSVARIHPRRAFWYVSRGNVVARLIGGISHAPRTEAVIHTKAHNVIRELAVNCPGCTAARERNLALS